MSPFNQTISLKFSILRVPVENGPVGPVGPVGPDWPDGSVTTAGSVFVEPGPDNGVRDSP